MKFFETRSTIIVYVYVVLVIIVFAILSQFVGIIGQLLYAIVAALFYFVPNKVIEKEEGTFEEYGLVFGDWKKGLLWGLGATLITFPLFVAGFWIWEVQIRKRNFDFDWAKYKQWDASIEGKSGTWGDKSGVWIWSDNEKLNVGLRNKKSSINEVFLTSSSPFEVKSFGAALLHKEDEGKRWRVVLSHDDSRGRALVLDAQDINVSVKPRSKGNKKWPMFLGPHAESIESFSENRGYLWILLWVATQFLLVAFPEEYFYRGFLQTRLSRNLEGRSKWWVLSPSIIFTSFLFGIGHLFVPVGGLILVTRFTVFFPSLIFGWLRDKTDSIFAGVIYHALCNLMVLVTALHFY